MLMALYLSAVLRQIPGSGLLFHLQRSTLAVSGSKCNSKHWFLSRKFTAVLGNFILYLQHSAAMG